jgi:plastocyanin
MTIMKRLLAILALAVLTLSACGGDSDNGGNSGQEEGSSDGGASSTLSVAAQDFQFSPTELNVEPGAEVTIEFTNEGEAPHTFTSEDVDVDESLDPGGSTTISFTAGESGTIEWHCTIHTSMTGTISIGDGDDAGGSGSSSNDSDSLDY